VQSSPLVTSPTQPPSALSKVSFFTRIGADVDVVKTALLLTGAFHGIKNQVRGATSPAARSTPRDGDERASL
jgi:hypothetical protein